MAKVRKARYIYQDGVYYEVGGGSSDSPADLSDLILVQDDEPTTPDNKIWIKETATPVEIPEMSDIADFVSFAEDQTSRTDAEKKQARDNIEAGGRWVKVWNNASPTSNFAGQTIPVDLSWASAAYVEFRWDTTYDNRFSGVSRIRSSEETSGLDVVADRAGKIAQRNFIATAEGVQFSSAWFANSYGSNSENNSYCIPLQIWAM